jgi:hypothetical protein
LFKISGLEVYVTLHLFHLCEEFLGKFCVLLAVLDAVGEIDHPVLELDELFIEADRVCHEFVDVADPVPVVVLELLEAIVEGDHAGLHLGDRTLGHVLELVDFLDLLVLALGHEVDFCLDAFFESAELVDPFHHFPVHPLLQLVELGDLLLVDLHDGLHPLDGRVRVDVRLGHLLPNLPDLVVLQLHVGRLLRALPLKQEILVFQFLLDEGLRPFYFVDFDGVLGLFLVEGLQEFAHDLPHLGLHLVPLELPYFVTLLVLGVLGRHLYFI